MSLQLNQVTIAGNLTRDPECKFLRDNRAVANFGVAINRTWKNDKGEKQQEATFVDCEAWGKTAEIVREWFAKGTAICVVGRLKLDQWEDDKKQKHQRLKVLADEVHFAGVPKTEEVIDKATGEVKRRVVKPAKGGVA